MILLTCLRNTHWCETANAWHVQHFWEDEEKWSLERALSDAGLEQFGKTFSYLAGEKMDWK